MSAQILGFGAAVWGGVGREGLEALLTQEGEPEKRLIGRLRAPRYSARYDRFQSMDGYSRLAFVAADHALDEAGLLDDSQARSPMAVVLGTRFGCHEANQRFDRFTVPEGGAPLVSPLAFKVTVDNAPGGWISVAFGLRGPNLTLVTGRAASAESIAEGLALLERQEAPVVLVGGVERSTALLRREEGDDAQQAEGAGMLVLAPPGTSTPDPTMTPTTLLGVFSNRGELLAPKLEAMGVNPEQVAWLVLDPQEGEDLEPRLSGVSGRRDRSLGARAGDLHGAWAAVASAAVCSEDQWSGGEVALIQAHADEAGLEHWIVLGRGRL